VDSRALGDSLVQLATDVGRAVLALYQRHREERLPIDRKSDDTPVTDADRAAHELLREGLHALRPDLPLLSEEGRQAGWRERRDWDEFWLVDPLDGTREFIHHTGEFCICIALVADGYPRLGVIHAPVDGTTWLGGEGILARRIDADGTTGAIATSAAPDRPAVVIVSSGGAKREDVREWTRTLARNWPGGARTRELGSALKFCAIAAGEAQAYPRFGSIGEWDSAAGQAIVEAAGGLVLNRKGQRLRYNQGEALVHRHLVAVADRSILDAAGFSPAAPAE
jgi:3'(2'), 5'-bisphosphate nucleotidase